MIGKFSQENTNKQIVANTIVLYMRLAITALCGLVTTRYALKALGVDDFGVFAVVGSIISFITIFNTFMLTTSNRFIATSIGKGDIVDINTTFNVNLVIHVVIAIFTLIILVPLGDYYVLNMLNYNGDIDNIRIIYHITIIASVFSFLGVPYNGLLIAKERFFVFCFTDVISSLLKMSLAILLCFYFETKLLIYAIGISIFTAYPTIIFFIYCKSHFPKITRWMLVKDVKPYQSVLSFSGWIAYGAVINIAKSSGSSLIINTFFSTVINTALGIANSVGGIVKLFAENLTKSISPQITKNYASGNIQRSVSLVLLASKLSFYVVLILCVPLLTETEFILDLWLSEIPPYAVMITRLILLDVLIISLNAGISDIIFAKGNIKWYQIVCNTLMLCSVVVGYIFLKIGLPIEWLFYSYIGFSLILVIIRQLFLIHNIKVSFTLFAQEIYFKAILIIILLYFILQLIEIENSFLSLLSSAILTLLFVVFIGFNKNDRGVIINIINH